MLSVGRVRVGWWGLRHVRRVPQARVVLMGVGIVLSDNGLIVVCRVVIVGRIVVVIIIVG